MRDIESIIRVTTDWWAEKVITGSVHKDGTDELPNFFAGIIANALNTPVTDPNAAEVFKTSLGSIIREKLQDRKTFTLKCDYKPDVWLSSAAEIAGVPLDNFPWKTSTHLSMYDEEDAVVLVEGHRGDTKTVLLGKEMPLITFEMDANVLFNRPINPDTNYISIGGFEMVMNGVAVHFDFEDYKASVDADNRCLLRAGFEHPDVTSFPVIATITDTMLSNISGIPEFFIYLGEEKTDLSPVEIESLSFSYHNPNGNPDDDWKVVNVEKDVLKAATLYKSNQEVDYETL